MKRIKYVLCNENGGPNLENLLGIAISLAIMGIAISFKNVSYGWLKGEQKREASMYRVRTY